MYVHLVFDWYQNWQILLFIDVKELGAGAAKTFLKITFSKLGGQIICILWRETCMRSVSNDMLQNLIRAEVGNLRIIASGLGMTKRS